MELEWVDAFWGWMHDWVHHHEESSVCDNLEDNYVASPQLQILDLQVPVSSAFLFPSIGPQAFEVQADDSVFVLVDPALDRRNGKRGP